MEILENTMSSVPTGTFVNVCIRVFVHLCICASVRSSTWIRPYSCICVFARVCVVLGYGHDLLSTSPMVSTSACTEPLTDTVARRD